MHPFGGLLTLNTSHNYPHSEKTFIHVAKLLYHGHADAGSYLCLTTLGIQRAIKQCNCVYVSVCICSMHS